MSQSAHPITPALFAEALKDLPLDTLHTKAAELQNSISHLKSSNAQLQPLADEGDEDCKLAVEENLEVVGRMRERVELCKKEAEGRGLIWHMGSEEDKEGEKKTNGVASGSLTDEEVRRRLEESLGGDEEDDGVHL